MATHTTTGTDGYDYSVTESAGDITAASMDTGDTLYEAIAPMSDENCEFTKAETTYQGQVPVWL